MIGSPQDSRLATHDLIPLDLLRNGLQCDLTRDMGISSGREGERVVSRERVGVVEGRHGRTGSAGPGTER